MIIHRRTRCLLFFTLAALGCAGASLRAQPTVAGCDVFPADNIWNWPVDGLPVHPSSSTWIETIGSATGLKADFGSGLWQGAPIGIPYDVVGADQPGVPMIFDWDDESDPGPYPVPPDAAIEGGPASDGDRHVLIVDRDACRIYELFYAYPQNGGASWSAASGAVYDLSSNGLRPDGWTSADAAGLPILPGLVRYEEILEGEIRHAIRFTAPQTQKAHLWPARHDASGLTSPVYPPLGMRVRLEASYEIGSFSATNQVILRALKKYGLILADNGSPWFLSGVPDARWDNDDLRDLLDVVGADLEIVDASGLMVDPDSGSVGEVFSDDFENGLGSWSSMISE